METSNWKLQRAIKSNELSIKSIVENINTLKKSKQETLTAGENIKIEDNVISCTLNVNDEVKNLTVSTINGCSISDTFTTTPYIQTVGWHSFNVMQNIDFHNQTDQNYIWRLSGVDNIFSIQKYDETRSSELSLFSFGADNNRPETTSTDSFIEIKRPDTTTDFEWRIYAVFNHNLDFVNYKNQRAGYIDYSSNKKMNTTIIHNAPIAQSAITENIDNYEIGTPVFMSGMVYSLKDNIYINETTSTDCIPSVKSSGTYKEFLGIVVNKHKSGDKVTIGDVMKKDIIINQDTIDFATHGDYYFKVNYSSKYSIGDTILFDGTIVDDDLPITNKITKSIVGTITGKINQNYVSVFKSC